MGIPGEFCTELASPAIVPDERVAVRADGEYKAYWWYHDDVDGRPGVTHALVAQWIERRFAEPEAVGSIPT